MSVIHPLQQVYIMPLSLFLVVVRRDKTIDTRRIILVQFDETTGALIEITRSIPVDLHCAIIPISKTEFERQVEKHGLPRRSSRRILSRAEKNKAYRKNIERKRKKRNTRLISPEIKARVIELLKNSQMSGVAISIQEGVSTSYVSRLKRQIERGEL